MFGGVGVYAAELFFALLDDDTLYFKVDDQTRAQYTTAGARPFSPYGEESSSMSYYEVPVDVLEDVDQLRRWAQEAVAAAARKAASSKRRKRNS